MPFFVIGAIAIVAAPIMLLIRASQQKKLGQIQGTETSTCAQLEETRAQVNSGVGAGSFIQRAEVKGVSECDQPLRAEFTGSACVAYSIKLEREYEEQKWETDSEGRRTQRTVRGSETLSSNERRAPFRLRDSTGAVKVVPDGADLVMETSLSKFENSFAGDRFSVGSFAFDLARSVLGAGRKTLGYRYEERIIPVGRDLYVLGEAADSTGDLVIRRSSTKGEKFIISVKSEEELVAGAQKAVTGLFIGSIVAAVIGVGLVIAGFFVR
jgi:hypothetical protein